MEKVFVLFQLKIFEKFHNFDVFGEFQYCSMSAVFWPICLHFGKLAL